MNKKLVFSIIIIGCISFEIFADKPNKGKMVMFAKEISKCIKTNNLICLEKFLPDKMHFPEQKEFACLTSDRNQNYISKSEFIKCVETVTKIDTSDGGRGFTLKDVLLDCFSSTKAEIVASMLYFQAASGYMCHLNDDHGYLKIESVGPGE